MNESIVKTGYNNTKCADCKCLKIINSDTLYAICKKTNFEFKPFEVDTREHSCEFGDKRR